MRITLKEVGPVQKEKKHFIIPVKYDDKGKEWDRKIYSFAADAYKAMKDAKAGETYDIEVAKNDNGFWEWVKVTKVEGSAAASAPVEKVGTVRSNYETPQERALRQVHITRQSSLAQAVAFLKDDDNSNADEVLSLAEKFENWVFRTSPVDLEDDKPWENE